MYKKIASTPSGISYVVSNSLWRRTLHLSTAKLVQAGPYQANDSTSTLLLCWLHEVLSYPSLFCWSFLQDPTSVIKLGSSVAPARAEVTNQHCTPWDSVTADCRTPIQQQILCFSDCQAPAPVTWDANNLDTD